MLKPKSEPPVTRRDELRERLHGVEVEDPYRWLEDAAAPEVQAWMAAQDEHARRELGALSERAGFLQRLNELVYIDNLGVPVPRGGRLFYFRRRAREEKAALCWREGVSGEERVLLDPNGWDEPEGTALAEFWPSWDGRRLVYAIKPNNSDEATLRVLEVETGLHSAIDVVPGAKYASPQWTPGGDGFYYTFLPSDAAVSIADRPGTAEIRFHRLGTPPEADPLIRPATGDPRTFTGVQLSRDGRWLLHVVIHGTRSIDIEFRDLAAGPAAPWRTLVAGREAHYEAVVHDGRFYVATDEGAPFGRVLRVDPERPEREAWQEVVPERPGRAIDSIRIVGGRLTLVCLENASSRLELHELGGGLVREVALPTLGTVTAPSGLEEADTAWFSFTSFTHPPEVHQLSVASGETRPWFRPVIPFTPDAFEVEQLWSTSRDGTRVPMFVVHRRGLARDGQHPTLLFGYGGFQVSQTPGFGFMIATWVEKGGVFAIANLRGGLEFGEDWHRGGMLERKQNVFDDFIASAGALVAAGWTRPARLAIRGGSNGGLLVGAVMTQRPDLYGAVLCSVPLLDMLRYHLHGSGKTWIAEYGSADDPALFPVLHAYSPYHRLVPGTPYPPLLMLSADSDDRVDPNHARKFVAALRHASCGGPVWLRIERQAGHGGADLRSATAERLADELAFAWAALVP